MLPKISLSCWAVLPLLFTSCGESAEAAAADASRVEVLTSPAQEKRASLSRQIEETRARMRVLRREKSELDKRLQILMPADLQSEEAKAWRKRVQDLRLEIVRMRADLNGMLDEIAELSKGY